MIAQSDIARRFAYHAPRSEGVIKAHELTRELCHSVADTFNALLPDGREKSTAITKIEEAMMWANAAIARNPDGVTDLAALL